MDPEHLSLLVFKLKAIKRGQLNVINVAVSVAPGSSPRSGSSPTQYLVTLVSPYNIWTIRRRFSDFRDLHHDIQIDPSVGDVPFPWRWPFKLNKQALEHRRHDLEVFLRRVSVEQADLMYSYTKETLNNFFEMERHDVPRSNMPSPTTTRRRAKLTVHRIDVRLATLSLILLWQLLRTGRRLLQRNCIRCYPGRERQRPARRTGGPVQVYD